MSSERGRRPQTQNPLIRSCLTHTWTNTPVGSIILT
jgi:hypothetical protein